jgi:hypothetical protein
LRLKSYDLVKLSAGRVVSDVLAQRAEGASFLVPTFRPAEESAEAGQMETP